MTHLNFICTSLLVVLLTFPTFANSPTVKLNGSADTTINVYSTYQDESATAYDLEDGNITSAIKVSGVLNVSLIGNYALIYKVTDSDGHKDSVTRIIRVRDIEKPVLHYLGQDSLCIQQFVPHISPGAKAIDNYDDSSIHKSLMFASNVNNKVIGEYWEKFWVTDSSGNFSDTLYITVFIGVDCVPPILTILGTIDTTIALNAVWVDPGATALDAFDGDLTLAIVASGTVNTQRIGEYDITYDVQDSHGNMASSTRKVSVLDPAYIKTFQRKQIAHLSPNPVSDFLNISLININPYSIEIWAINAIGKKVRLQIIEEKDKFSLSVRDLSPGVYYFEIRSADEVQWEKVIVR